MRKKDEKLDIMRLSGFSEPRVINIGKKGD